MQPAASNPFNVGYFPAGVSTVPEPEQEEGYPPPDPALYNFHASDPLMQGFFQPQQKREFQFARRINKMNWELIGNINVGQIAVTGDVASVEYLMPSIAFANITQEDAEIFGSRPALHAFLLLQMSVEILLAKLANIPTTPPPAAPQLAVTPHQIAQYEAKIDLLTKDIKARDSLISNLAEKLRVIEANCVSPEFESIPAIPKKHNKASDVEVSVPKRRTPKQPVMEVEKPVKLDVLKRPSRGTLGRTESGADHLDTAYQEYLEAVPARFRPKTSSTSKKKKKPKVHSDWTNSGSFHWD
jgi:hypothetical protein